MMIIIRVLVRLTLKEKTASTSEVSLLKFLFCQAIGHYRRFPPGYLPGYPRFLIFQQIRNNMQWGLINYMGGYIIPSSGII